MLTSMSRLWARLFLVNTRNCAGLQGFGRVGPGVAPAALAWVGCALGCLPIALSGCLVTDEITFDEEPDLPTVIVDAPASKTPIGSIVWLDKHTQPSWKFVVKIRDENSAQELKAHYRVVSEDDAMPPFESPPVPADDAELRDLELTVKSETLRDGECHQLQLAVSPWFFDSTLPGLFDFVPPGREASVARASWTLWEGPGDMLATDWERLARSCRAIDDLLAPTAVEEVP